MTLLEERPVNTAAGPTASSVWRRNRGLLALGVLLVAALTLLAVIGGTGKAGALDPDTFDPAGAHALAQLLRDQGIEVLRTTDVPSTTNEATAASTVFVPLPGLLSDEELQQLSTLPGTMVVAGAGPRTLGDLDTDTTIEASGDTRVVTPSCSLRAAVKAGRARAGGYTYSPGPHDDGAVGCYPIGSSPSVLSLPNKHLVLVGAAEAFTNKRLTEAGNAALGLNLLGGGDKVVWLMPASDRAAFGNKPVGSPDSLLPESVRTGRLQLVVVVGLLALWRARRLGRVVPEPLPVVVRASETVEGRGRLYRVARARDTAAESLRAGARDQLSRRVHSGHAPTPAALVAAVSDRSSASPLEVEALLYGRAPSDDAALVRLADQLDSLIQEVAGS
ncbi:MAG: hypothetical protein JWO12_1747 [Frankiales bacterium]|nr:hypothetical protein [Frankiales bacterium]